MKTPERQADSGFDWPHFVTASADEIRYAEELRRQIERRYLAPATASRDDQVNLNRH